MDKDYPVFVYMDNGEKIQIGVATANDGPQSDFTLELTVTLYVESEEDKILLDIDPKDIPDIEITL